MTKYFYSAFKVLSIAIVLSLSLSYAYAWTPPAATPPLDNVSEPINTSATAQTKAGDICTTSGGSTVCLSTASASGLPVGNEIGQTVRWEGASWGISDPGDILVNGITLGMGSGDWWSTRFNTAVGKEALVSNINGFNNTANGVYSLFANTTGFYNTANGAYTLSSNTTGDSNTASGSATLSSNEGGSQNSAFGSDSLSMNISGSRNTATGLQSIRNNSVGNNNTGTGYRALISNDTGNNNTAIGYSADVSSGALTNATAIGANAVVDASNKVRIGNAAVTVIGGQVAWSNLSDARLKKDVVDYTHGLDFITRLRPVSFKFTTDATNQTHSGFIAQEVEMTGIPFYGINKPATKDGYYSLSYAEFVVPLVNSVKELKTENDKLKADNEALRKEIKANNDALISRIEKLEAAR